MGRKRTIIGQAVIRPDALAKVQGRARYIGDLFLERKNCLVGRALFAPCSHARLLRVDTSAAEALPGVAAVMTAKDLPGLNAYGAAAPDKPVLADDIIRYQGDPVAFVAAVDRQTADRAVALIRAEYEPLEPQLDPRENLRPDAPLIHENHPISRGSNVSSKWRVERGDAAAALAQSDIVLENDFETQMADHAYLETENCLAEPDEIEGGIHLIAPGHSAHLNCRSLAAAFGLPHSRVHVTTPIVGGSFGGKEDSNLEVAVMAGVLALKTGRPVFCEYTREESLRNSGKRHATRSHRKLGATKDGVLTAVEADIVVDKGAYRSIDPIPQRMSMYGGGVYRIPNAKVEARSVFTHHVYGCAFRGLGVPQAMFSIECQMDDLARRLGMDPVELRLKNLLREGDSMITGQVMRADRGLGLEKCIREVCGRIGWDRPLEQSSDPNIRRGRGIAAIMYGSGTGYPDDGAHCFVNLQMDGSLMVGIGTAELGQGGLAAMTQIAAETLGIPCSMVNVNYSDNHASPETGATVASRSTVFAGNAIVRGCTILKERMLGCAGKLLEEAPENLEIEDGIISVRGNEEKSVPLRQVVRAAYMSQVPLTAVGDWYPPLNRPDPVNGQDDRMHTYTFGAQAVEVSVDIGTGVYTLDRSVAAFDIGRVINPLCAEGQVEGGVTQGIGYAMMENFELKNGIAVSDTYHSYLIPTSMDLPSLETILVEAPNELGPYGAKGVGEPPVTAAAPAIRNALLDAVGIPFYSLPITPMKVLAALKAREREEA